VRIGRSGTLSMISVILALGTLISCRQETAIWVEPGSTVSHLVFGISRTVHGDAPVAIGVLRVERCRAGPGDAMWVVGPRGGTTDIRQIVYAETPPGFVSDIGPKALGPGCYRARVSGTGEVEFVVAEDGAVVEHRPSRED
jgi:hypothetical protein